MVEFDRKQELTRLRKKAEDFKRRAERGTRMIGDDEELRDTCCHLYHAEISAALARKGQKNARPNFRIFYIDRKVQLFNFFL